MTKSSYLEYLSLLNRDTLLRSIFLLFLSSLSFLSYSQQQVNQKLEGGWRIISGSFSKSGIDYNLAKFHSGRYILHSSCGNVKGAFKLDGTKISMTKTKEKQAVRNTNCINRFKTQKIFLPAKLSYVIHGDTMELINSKGEIKYILKKVCAGYGLSNVVTGVNHQFYLNECAANKLGIEVLDTLYHEEYYDETNYYTWKIGRVCETRAIQSVKRLDDGTIIYRIEQQLVRSIPNMCKCLPPETLIATPSGEKEISQLIIGDTIWSVSATGGRIAAPIENINKVKVDNKHRVLELTLADKRKLKVTPNHPSFNPYIMLNEFEIGDTLDGSVVTGKKTTYYNKKFTHDILPKGKTGGYWANGILIGSTLFETFSSREEGK